VVDARVGSLDLDDLLLHEAAVSRFGPDAGRYENMINEVKEKILCTLGGRGSLGGLLSLGCHLFVWRVTRKEPGAERDSACCVCCRLTPIIGTMKIIHRISLESPVFEWRREFEACRPPLVDFCCGYRE